MKDVVYMTAAAWEDISASTLQKSWNKLLHSAEVASQASSADTTDIENENEVMELAQQLDGNLETEDVNGWMAVDNNDMGYQLLSDVDIIKEVAQMAEDEDDEETEDISEGDPTIPTSEE